MCEYNQAIPFEAISQKDWLHTDVDLNNTFDWLIDVTDLRHNTFATSIPYPTPRHKTGNHFAACELGVCSANTDEILKIEC